MNVYYNRGRTEEYDGDHSRRTTDRSSTRSPTRTHDEHPTRRRRRRTRIARRAEPTDDDDRIVAFEPRNRSCAEDVRPPRRRAPPKSDRRVQRGLPRPRARRRVGRSSLEGTRHHFRRSWVVSHRSSDIDRRSSNIGRRSPILDPRSPITDPRSSIPDRRSKPKTCDCRLGAGRFRPIGTGRAAFRRAGRPLRGRGRRGGTARGRTVPGRSPTSRRRVR